MKDVEHVNAIRMAIANKAVLTAEEAAVYMGISLSGLYKLTMRHKIPGASKPTGKKYYFDRVILERFLLGNPIATDAEINNRANVWAG